MLDLQRQRQTMLNRLAYYRRVINERSDGYRQLKLGFSIPNTKKALAKIDDGTYGYCEDCGEKIADERLIAIPAALRCLECQQQEEEKHKRLT